ncbi:MAG: hypothetical protein GY864_00285 [Desulfobacterales bacterium]|nr:hypothetical protein [Desulfobacterales bacterium]
MRKDRYKKEQRKKIRPKGRKEKQPMGDMLYKWIFFMIVMLALLGAAPAAWATESSAVAKGDRFEVTVGDVVKFKEFTEKSGPYRTTPKEYRDYMVKLNLFVLEASALGISLPGREAQSSELSIEDLLSFRALYLEKLLEEEFLDDLVIRSYYSAFPEKFLVNSMEDGRTHLQPRDMGLGDDVELLPLDDQLKEDIRGRLRNVMTKRVERQAFKRLCEKYSVRICNPETGECE